MEGTIPGTEIPLAELSESAGRLEEFRVQHPELSESQLVAGLDALIVSQQDAAVRALNNAKESHA